jgi:cytochrome P450
MRRAEVALTRDVWGATVITKDGAMTTSQLVFDPFSEEYYAYPYDIYRRMRDEAPVYYSEQYDFYALSRHEDVAVAFKDFETYSS